MASIKLKFRASAINGERGVLYYQIIHKRTVRQITTNYRIYVNEWDKHSETIIVDTSSKRLEQLSDIHNQVTHDIKRMRNIIVHLDSMNIEFTADDIVSEYLECLKKLSFITAMQRHIEQLRLIGKIRTSETYTASLRSFREFLGNRDIYFDVIDSNLMLRYEAFLKRKNLTMNTISFYMRILRAVYNRGVEDNITEQKKPFKNVYTGIDKTI